LQGKTKTGNGIKDNDVIIGLKAVFILGWIKITYKTD